MTTLAETAIRYAEHGWKVFPLRARDKLPHPELPKAPPGEGGFKFATSDVKQVRAWWHQWPEANIGLWPGPSGLVVIDVDGPRGEGAARELELLAEPTWTVATGRPEGGFHLYYQRPDAPIGNHSAIEGLDVRADNGYVILPPSIHPSGTPYRWERHDGSPRKVPPKLLTALTMRRNGNGTTSRRDLSERIPEGQRDSTLTSFAGTLRRRGMSPAAILAQLRTFNEAHCDPPVEDSDLERIARSVGRYKPAHPEPECSDPTEFHHTDLGNAQRFVLQYGNQVHYMPSRGKWLIWDGCRWAVDETGQIHRLAHATILGLYREAEQLTPSERKTLVTHATKSENRGRLDAMLGIAQTLEGIPVLPDDLDADPWLLNCLNGTIDLSSGELRAHDPADLITKLVPVAYDTAAVAPVFSRFLKRICNDDPALMTYVQRAVGYALTGSTKLQVFFVAWGKGSNGKSTLFEVLRDMAGDYALQASASTFLEQETTRIRSDIARLRGARLVTASEPRSTGRRQQLDEATVKALTGSDRVVGEYKYQEPFEFTPQFTLFLYTNYKPRILGTDLGIQRRVRLIPFTVTIGPEERDDDLPDRLRTPEELAGILAWAVQGCLEWQAEGLGTCSAVEEATAEYLEEEDDLKPFLDECCVLQRNASVEPAQLYARYQEWAEAQKLDPLKNRTFFNRLYGRSDLKPVKSHGQRYVWGVQIIDGGRMGSDV